MKRTYFMLIVLLAIWGQRTQAQDADSQFRLFGIDAGIISISDYFENSHIRESAPNFNQFYSTNFNVPTTNSFVGIKYEFYKFNNWLDIAAGLRYYQYDWKLEAQENDKPYFYWLVSEENLNTEIYRITEISQTAKYMGVPLELRVFPWARRRLVSIFFKLGGDVSIRVQTKKKVTFFSPGMDAYAGDIEAQIQDPSTVHFSAYLSSGLCIGSAGKINFTAELCAPFLSTAASGLFFSSTSEKPTFSGGVGVQFNLQIPIHIATK